MKIIAIDCRYIGMSGIGRVLEGFLDSIDYEENKYVLIGDYCKLKKYKCYKIINDLSNPFSIKGLFRFPKEINDYCDSVFFPNFLIPLGIKIKSFIIIHDLIFLDEKSSTKGFVDKSIKKYLLKRGSKKASIVFCDSIFTVTRCKHYFKKESKKFVLNYPGISKSIMNYNGTKTIKDNKIIFVGNVKPHKGIGDLLKAFSLIEDKTMILKIIGEKNSFLTGLKIDETKLTNVVFTGRISDEELFREIETAKFLIQPSKYEGFGLPPLEALILGTVPIVSNIEVFKEVYKDLPVIFYDTVYDLSKKIMLSPYIIEDNYSDLIFEKYNYKNFSEEIIKWMSLYQ